MIVVSAPSQLLIDVSELLRIPGSVRDVHLRRSAEGLAVAMSKVEPGSELDLDLRVESLVDGIHVAGRMSGEVQMQCRRCLGPIHQHQTIELNEVFLPHGEATEEDQAYEIVDERIDLEPVIRDAVVLALPLNPLCRPDCKGLCPVCGADRNATDCGHTEKRTDVRWTVLEELRNKMEG